MRSVPRMQPARLALIVAVVATVAILAPTQALWLLPTVLIVAPVAAGRFVGESWMVARLLIAVGVTRLMDRPRRVLRSNPRSRPLLRGIFARPPPPLFGQ